MQDAVSTISSAADVRENLARIRQKLADAAADSGRPPSAVTLVAVTKSVGPREARFLLEAGCRDLGENRPEQLASRAADQSLAGARWHLIGTYQRRKVKDTLASVAVVHSIHSAELGAAISARAAELGRDVSCLVQANVSGEPTKQGFAPAEIRPALDRLRILPHLKIEGLMTMAPEAASRDERRRIFAETRALRDALRDPSLPLPELSMGMSGDFVEAVLEGATLVRIGTALFLPPGARDSVS